MFTKVLRSFGMRGRVLTLDAPISGDVIPLSEVNDQTFATGLLGQGVAIQPTGTRNRSLDARELDRVTHQNGNRHIVAFGRDCLAIELDEHVALVDNVAHLRMHGKVLALKLNGRGKMGFVRS